jgi:hypothetical protein
MHDLCKGFGALLMRSKVSLKKRKKVKSRYSDLLSASLNLHSKSLVTQTTNLSFIAGTVFS